MHFDVSSVWVRVGEPTPTLSDWRITTWSQTLEPMTDDGTEMETPLNLDPPRE